MKRFGAEYDANLRHHLHLEESWNEADIDPDRADSEEKT
jgi:hypothetical protein